MVKLPKDAEGNVIPFDIDILYDKVGNKVEVECIKYITKCSVWLVVDSKGDTLSPGFLYIEKPCIKRQLGEAREGLG